MKKTNQAILPDTNVNAAVKVFGALASGQTPDPGDIMAAMPAVQVIQKAMDTGENIIITGTKKED